MSWGCIFCSGLISSLFCLLDVLDKGVTVFRLQAIPVQIAAKNIPGTMLHFCIIF